MAERKLRNARTDAYNYTALAPLRSAAKYKETHISDREDGIETNQFLPFRGDPIRQNREERQSYESEESKEFEKKYRRSAMCTPQPLPFASALSA